MSERQQYVDRVRTLQKELKVILDKGKFVKDVERFQIQEAMFNLNTAESTLTVIYKLIKIVVINYVYRAAGKGWKVLCLIEA